MQKYWNNSKHMTIKQRWNCASVWRTRPLLVLLAMTRQSQTGLPMKWGQTCRCTEVLQEPWPLRCATGKTRTNRQAFIKQATIEKALQRPHNCKASSFLTTTSMIPMQPLNWFQNSNRKTARQSRSSNTQTLAALPVARHWAKPIKRHLPAIPFQLLVASLRLIKLWMQHLQNRL